MTGQRQGLSAEEREALRGLGQGQVPAVVERLLAARLAQVTARADAAEAKVAAVRALADEWRYKGEFGWGAWQEGHGPDFEGDVLDRAASRLRAALDSPGDAQGGGV